MIAFSTTTILLLLLFFLLDYNLACDDFHPGMELKIKCNMYMYKSEVVVFDWIKISMHYHPVVDKIQCQLQDGEDNNADRH